MTVCLLVTFSLAASALTLIDAIKVRQMPLKALLRLVQCLMTGWVAVILVADEVARGTFNTLIHLQASLIVLCSMIGAEVISNWNGKKINGHS